MKHIQAIVVLMLFMIPGLYQHISGVYPEGEYARFNIGKEVLPNCGDIYEKGSV